MPRKRWPRRVRSPLEYADGSQLVVNMNGQRSFKDGDPVVIMSAAEARYLDKCRRELRALVTALRDTFVCETEEQPWECGDDCWRCWADRILEGDDGR